MANFECVFSGAKSPALAVSPEEVSVTSLTYSNIATRRRMDRIVGIG